MTPRKPKPPNYNFGNIQDQALGGADEPDSETKKEAADLDQEEKTARVRGLLQDISERKLYANRIFWMLSLWLLGIFVLLLAQGFFSPHHWFELDKSVLLAAIGGTTVNVIGIFVVVTRYLFPQRPK